MSPQSTYGKWLLHALLPRLYRTEDNHGDLAAYLDACGELLDRLRNTLEQRLADTFPDRPFAGPASQAWLLPYFAQLFEVRLRSPHVAGRREEVARAVAWRQGKGTLPVIERIAEAVGQLDVEIQEGWRRVAVTARIGLPLLPARYLGEATEPDSRHPGLMARHPGLPAVTLDLRHASRAVQTGPENPASKLTRFRTEAVTWRQLNRHGVPCFPGSFEDVSLRTVDLRTPDWRRGHYHPQRVLLYAPPPHGFFTDHAVVLLWGQRNQPKFRDLVAISDRGDHVYNPYHEKWQGQEIIFTTSPPPFKQAKVTLENLTFQKTLSFNSNEVVLKGVAARKVVVTSPDGGEPVLHAVDCLFGSIEVQGGLVRLENCTVRWKIQTGRIQASDCIFTGPITIERQEKEAHNCIRYSRIPKELNAPKTASWLPRVASNTTEKPIFYDFTYCAEGGGELRSAEFGALGFSVLHPATPDAICFGAEDGGEMGAYHRKAYCLQHRAILQKLEDFLPLGQEAVLIPDPRLLHPPPKLGARTSTSALLI